MDLNNEIVIRFANRNDIDFILEGFIEAEKGGGSIIPTQKIFNLTLERFKEYFINFLNDDDIIDCEYSLKTYLIAEIDGVQAATFSHWVEGANSIKSGIIKINSWFYAIGAENIKKIERSLEIANKYNLTRINNYLQLEYLYVSPNFRKKGLLKKLIKFAIENEIKKGSLFNGFQTILFMENTPSFNFFNERGFKVHDSVKIKDDALNIIFEHNTRLSMILERDRIDYFLKSL